MTVKELRDKLADVPDDRTIMAVEPRENRAGHVEMTAYNVVGVIRRTSDDVCGLEYDGAGASVKTAWWREEHTPRLPVG